MIFITNVLIIGLSLEAILGSPTSNNNGSLKIVNGTNVTNNNFPYMVNVRINDTNQCGGVLVNEEWVLTAGHCADNLVSIHYGDLHLDEGVFTNTVKVIKNFTHPSFTQIQNGSDGFLTLSGDLALMLLEHPLNFSETVKQAKFPEDNGILKEDNSTIGLSIGWGYIDGNETNPDLLQQVNLTIYNPEYCEDRYNGSAFFDPKTMFCAGDDQDTKGLCNGDSGSPFIIDDVVWGIVSYTQFPCILAPGVYTNVVPFLDWIKNVTGLTEL